MTTAIYLRKSRADNEAEDTLTRHKETLLSFAKANNLSIIKIYEEIVSGDSLFSRPQMLELLANIKENKYDAVLCMDIDRLGRGDMQEQGIIISTFKNYNTKIITPRKIYDLNDELDETYSEFQAFMARQELKLIKKRLRQGIKKSVEDGAYLSNPPYGYKKVMVDKMPTLEIVEDEAKIVRIIFDMYVNQGVGSQIIAEHINSLGAKPRRSDAFSRTSVRFILSNVTYTGKTIWNKKRHIRKSASNDRHIIIYNPPEEWVVTDGIHPAIVSEELFQQAEQIRMGKKQVPHYKGVIVNPLAGLIRCSKCGNNLQMQNKKDKNARYLICNTKNCCRGIKLDHVEERILSSLEKIITEFEKTPQIMVDKNTDNLEAITKAIKEKNIEMAKAKEQMDNLHDLLEQKIYTIDVFMERSQTLKDKTEKLNADLGELQKLLKAEKNMIKKTSSLIPNIKNVLAQYPRSSPKAQNKLLKEVINYALYTKSKEQWGNKFDLKLTLNV